jgi:hypothetical protein
VPEDDCLTAGVIDFDLPRQRGLALYGKDPCQRLTRASFSGPLPRTLLAAGIEVKPMRFACKTLKFFNISGPNNGSGDRLPSHHAIRAARLPVSPQTARTFAILGACGTLLWVMLSVSGYVFRDSSDGRSATRADGRLNWLKVGLARA